MSIQRTNINYKYYADYQGSYYYYYKATGYGLGRNSGTVYAVKSMISGIYDFIRAKCLRVNYIKNKGGGLEECYIDSYYVYCQQVDLLANYAGYKIRLKSIDKMDNEVVLEGKEVV